MADEKRFEITYRQKGWDLDTQIIVDTCTGVNYLVLKNGTHVDAITPLLNTDGTPVITRQNG